MAQSLGYHENADILKGLVKKKIPNLI